MEDKRKCWSPFQENNRSRGDAWLCLCFATFAVLCQTGLFSEGSTLKSVWFELSYTEAHSRSFSFWGSA